MRKTLRFRIVSGPLKRRRSHSLGITHPALQSSVSCQHGTLSVTHCHQVYNCGVFQGLC